MTDRSDALAGAIGSGDLPAARASVGLPPASAAASGWAELGFALAHTPQAALATLAFERALLLERRASWLSALGVLHMRANRTAEAIAAGEAAVSLQPDDPACLDNLALSLADAGRYEDAKICFTRAIGLAPDRAASHLSLAQLLLSTGEMQPGWLEYEWRNRTEMARDTMPPSSAATWNGMAMRRGRLVVVGDQGFGDTIQFARFLPRVAALCPDTQFCVSPPLLELLQQVPGPVAWHTRWEDVPPHAALVRLSSLPFLFRVEPDTIPAAGGYLVADASARARWCASLADDDGGSRNGALRVGLVWAGRSTHPNNMRRSIRLDQLLPLAGIPGVRFVCLQKPVPEADRPLLERFNLRDLSDRLVDFSETAALLAELDLVIAVDTSTAHLAGALGKPCWLMPGHPPDWRWGVSGSRTAWYDSVTLVRQPSPGDWAGTVRAVAARLEALVASRGSRAAPDA